MAAEQTISRHREDYHFWEPVPLRYSDQDAMQHINNVAVCALLEAGRVSFLESLFEGTERSAFAMVLARVTIDYLNELTFPGTVDVCGRIVKIGGRSLTSQYAIFQRGECCVVSQSVNVFFDSKTRRSAQPPQALLDHIRQFQSIRAA